MSKKDSKWINWYKVEDKLPNKSGVYYCQVTTLYFDDNNNLFHYWVFYNKKTGWDTDHLTVAAWCDNCEKRKTSEVY